MRNISLRGAWSAAIVLTVILFVSAASVSAAQDTASHRRVASPAEHARGLRLYPVIGMNNAEFTEDADLDRVPDALIDSALQARAKGWAASLSAAPTKGIQLDAKGEVEVAAGNDAVAREQFANRLATPGLSVDDRAFTLLTAVQAFGMSAANTARMRVAYEYVAQLDALPQSPSVAAIQFRAHQILAIVYYNAGNAAQSSAELRKAFADVPATPFLGRNDRIADPFWRYADIVSGMPDGRAQIDSMANYLLAQLQAPPALLATNPGYQGVAMYMTNRFKKLLVLTNHLGRQAPPIAAQFWFNTPRPSTKAPPEAGDSAVRLKTLDDGKIRVIEIGDSHCGACMAALPKLDSLSRTLPRNVEVWFIPQEADEWGADPCAREVCAEHWRNNYVEFKKFTLPIALWIGLREPNPDGGTRPIESPTWRALQIETRPTMLVTDGRGRVRHIEIGASQDVLLRTLKYLMAEAGHAASTQPASAAPVATTSPASSH